MDADQGRQHGASLLVRGVARTLTTEYGCGQNPRTIGYPRAALVGCARVRWCGGFAMPRWKHYPSLEERFWPKVEKTDGCWYWTASCDPCGYGHFSIDGKLHSAHRVSWELAYGPIPDRLDVLHKCDNPPCVRPDHLFLGTHTDNMVDMISKGRKVSIMKQGRWRHQHPKQTACGQRNGTQTHPERLARGVDGGRAKLTWEQVVAIRECAATGMSQYKLAEEFGVHGTTINRIVRGLLWKHAGRAQFLAVLVRQRAMEEAT
jgi:HNH endonuclease